MPAAAIIPVLTYDDLDDAVRWLGAAFGFRERVRIGDHRSQLTLDTGGDMVVKQGTAHEPRPFATHTIMMRVVDADAHCARALASGAEITIPPTDCRYGERQYSAVDCGGHCWTFSQTIADVAPESWGGRTVEHAHEPE